MYFWILLESIGSHLKNLYRTRNDLVRAQKSGD